MTARTIAEASISELAEALSKQLADIAAHPGMPVTGGREETLVEGLRVLAEMTRRVGATASVSAG